MVVLCTPALCDGVASPPTPKVKVRCASGAAPSVSVALLAGGLFGLSFVAPPGKNSHRLYSHSDTA